MKPIAVIIAGLVIIGVMSYYLVVLDDTINVPQPSTFIPLALGDVNAPITIEEWGDYQCTYCKRFHSSSLITIKEQFIDTGMVKLVFMDFPLNGALSVDAAAASHCAADQDAYWEYHDILYDNWAGENTGWISSTSLKSFAVTIGLDEDMFAQCVDSSKYHNRVTESYNLGQSKGIDSTPSFLITNGDKVFKIRGNQPLDTFLRVIAEL